MSGPFEDFNSHNSGGSVVVTDSLKQQGEFLRDAARFVEGTDAHKRMTPSRLERVIMPAKVMPQIGDCLEDLSTHGSCAFTGTISDDPFRVSIDAERVVLQRWGNGEDRLPTFEEEVRLPSKISAMLPKPSAP